MKITLIERNKNKYLLSKEKFNTTSQVTKNNNSISDLSNLPSYSYQVNFKGTNNETIQKMENLIQKNGYKFEELKKLFDELSDIAKNNVNGTVELLKNEGLTFEAFLPSAVKAGAFYKSPKTTESNVKELVKIFEKEGLNTNDYIKACVKQPQLFCQSPKTIEANVKELVKIFEKEGLNTNDYIKACVKQPQLFCRSPKSIEEHIKAYMYAKKMKQGCKDKNIMDKILCKNLTYSTSLIYLQDVILAKLKQQSADFINWEKIGLKPKLKEYFQNNPDKKFTIKILDDEMSGNFIKVIKEYCQKEFGRDDMFNIVICSL